MYDSTVRACNLQYRVAQDFAFQDKAAIQSAIFMADYRDAEIQTLKAMKVPILKIEAQSLQIKFAHNIRKQGLMDKILFHRCTLASL